MSHETVGAMDVIRCIARTKQLHFVSKIKQKKRLDAIK